MRMVVGIREAAYVSGSTTLRAIKRGKFWFLNGKAYKSPFEAFKALESPNMKGARHMEKTIRELCKRVAATGGLDVTNEAIVEYQDLIGHATEGENAELANTPELMESFYRIYGVAYGTVAAIKYYVQNSDKVNGLQCAVDDYKGMLEEKTSELRDAKDEIIDLKNSLKNYEGKLAEAHRDMEGTERALKVNEEEITRLKAKLFDLMEENEVLRKKVMQ